MISTNDGEPLIPDARAVGVAECLLMELAALLRGLEA
jgi:hypothetical protein